MRPYIREIHGLRTKSMDCCDKYGSMVCAKQSVYCANPYFAPNIYIEGGKGGGSRGKRKQKEGRKKGSVFERTDY